MSQKDNVIFRMKHRRVLSVNEIVDKSVVEEKENSENTFEYSELVQLVAGLKAEIKVKTDTERMLLAKIAKLRDENKALK